jgi:putative membrane protein
MMMWYSGGNWGWGSWILMTVAMVVFWAALITGAVLAVRYTASARRADTNPAALPTRAEELVAQRYARGEIDEDEYQGRVALLRPIKCRGGSSLRPGSPIGSGRSAQDREAQAGNASPDPHGKAEAARNHAARQRRLGNVL